MFQYAAAKALARRLNTTLYFDNQTFSKDNTQATTRHFELDIFKIDYPIRSTIKSKFLVKAYPYIQKHREFFQNFGFLTDTYAILYHPAFETIRGNITMLGYFQNDQYFKNIVSEIRNDFSFKKPLTGKNIDLSKKIKTSESISIHIRRGDYLTNKNATSNFITCNIDYYKNAIEYISDRINNPEFYVFSDDPVWVKNNINFVDHPVSYIDWNNGSDSYIDMQLMSLCKHNIIANSSFSWWGAWLNSNMEKIVIAPSKWFQEEKKNNLLDNFYPIGWIKI